jgi:hypothetical protein
MSLPATVQTRHSKIPPCPPKENKVDGQRQLTSVPVSLQAENAHFHLSFKIPVHAYLGTQFKLYATAKNGHDIQEVEEALKAVSDSTVPNKDGDCPAQFVVQMDLDPHKPAKTMCVGRGGTKFERVFFLVDKFRSTLSAGGTITNNFVNRGDPEPTAGTTS